MIPDYPHGLPKLDQEPWGEVCCFRSEGDPDEGGIPALAETQIPNEKVGEGAIEVAFQNTRGFHGMDLAQRLHFYLESVTFSTGENFV